MKKISCHYCAKCGYKWTVGWGETRKRKVQDACEKCLENGEVVLSKSLTEPAPNGNELESSGVVKAFIQQYAANVQLYAGNPRYLLDPFSAYILAKHHSHLKAEEEEKPND